MIPLSLERDRKNLETLDKLMKKDEFPPLPKTWKLSELLLSWYGKVCKAFNELKTCDRVGFQKICAYINEEFMVGGSLPHICATELCQTQIEYLEIVRQQDGSTYGWFEGFSVLARLEPNLLQQVGSQITSSCHAVDLNTHRHPANTARKRRSRAGLGVLPSTESRNASNVWLARGAAALAVSRKASSTCSSGSKTPIPLRRFQVVKLTHRYVETLEAKMRG